MSDRIGIEQFIKLRRPACRHTRSAGPEWFDALYCAETPLRGEPFCLVHRPPNFKPFDPEKGEQFAARLA